MARLRAGFRSRKTLELSFRRNQLRNLKRLLEENEKQILEALWKDLRKVERERERSLGSVMSSVRTHCSRLFADSSNETQGYPTSDSHNGHRLVVHVHP